MRYAPPEKLTLRCDRCSWVKTVHPRKIADSLRGHYGYAHPNRRIPEAREARTLAGLA